MSLIVIALLTSASAFAQTQDGDRSPASLELAARLVNARELLGDGYTHSVVRAGEQIRDVEEYLISWLDESLKVRKKSRRLSRKIADAIIAESAHYGFDPILITAIIATESHFNPALIGTVGEIGLMQVRPATARWIARKTDLEYRGRKALFNPVVNIRFGTAYLAYLRGQFDSHSRLYLAAYNMGQGNVERSLERNYWPKDYAQRVMKNYILFYTEIRDELRDKEITIAQDSAVESD